MNKDRKNGESKSPSLHIDGLQNSKGNEQYPSKKEDGQRPDEEDRIFIYIT